MLLLGGAVAQTSSGSLRFWGESTIALACVLPLPLARSRGGPTLGQLSHQDCLQGRGGFPKQKWVQLLEEGVTDAKQTKKYVPIVVTAGYLSKTHRCLHPSCLG